jgi:hypothetical protein
MPSPENAAGSNQVLGAQGKDPSENVRALMLAAIERLDALRDGQGARIDDLVKAEVRRIEQLASAETRRVDDLRNLAIQYTQRQQDAEARHTMESRQAITELHKSNTEHVRITEELRAEYQEKLAIAEAKRIDAIRSVDVAAVAVASERATQQASVLANQVAASADALRALVATTATTFAQQQQSLQTQITERLALLERSQYESKGKAGVTDPAQVEMLSEIKALRAAQSSGSGKAEGISTSTGVMVAVVTVGIALGGLIVSMRGSNGEKSAAQTPAIIYVQPQQTTPAPVVIQPGK